MNTKQRTAMIFVLLLSLAYIKLCPRTTIWANSHTNTDQYEHTNAASYINTNFDADADQYADANRHTYFDSGLEWDTHHARSY